MNKISREYLKFRCMICVINMTCIHDYIRLVEKIKENKDKKYNNEKSCTIYEAFSNILRIH